MKAPSSSTRNKLALLTVCAAIPLFLLSTHIFFEQWIWQWYLWVRFYHFSWWSTYSTVVEPLVLAAAEIGLLAILIIMASMVRNHNKRFAILCYAAGVLYALLSITCALAVLLTPGRDRIANVLQEIGGTQIPLIIFTLFNVVLPLGIITAIMSIILKRKVKAGQASTVSP